MNILYFIQNHAINYNLILSDIAPYCSLLIAVCLVFLQVKISSEKTTIQAENINYSPEKTDTKKVIRLRTVKNDFALEVSEKTNIKIKEIA